MVHVGDVINYSLVLHRIVRAIGETVQSHIARSRVDVHASATLTDWHIAQVLRRLGTKINAHQWLHHVHIRIHWDLNILIRWAKHMLHALRRLQVLLSV